MNRVRSKHAMPTMIRRLESFKVTDLSDVTVENKSLDSVERFISDVAYGWTRRQITCSESIELYKGLFKRITSEHLVVPPALLSTWLSLIARQTKPKLEEVKSLKLFQMPPKNHRENLISFVPQLLEHLKTATDLPRKLQFDQTVEYLVGLSKTSNDTKLLLEEHSKLPTSIASSRGWSMLLAKYCSERNSELEFVVDMIQIMILRDNIYPMKVIAPVLRQLYVKTRPDKTEYTHFGEETMLMDIIIRMND